MAERRCSWCGEWAQYSRESEEVVRLGEYDDGGGDPDEAFQRYEILFWFCSRQCYDEWLERNLAMEKDRVRHDLAYI